MSQPLYFLPGLNREHLAPGGKLSRAILRERGIEGVFADVADLSVDCGASNISAGPGGRSGCILYYQTPDGSVPNLSGYHPKGQDWVEVDGGLWIGTERDAPPTGEDLRRKKTYRGYPLDIAGRTLEVPIIRRVDDTTELPRDIRFVNGTYSEPIKSAYRKYWDDSGEVAAWILSGQWKDEYKPRALMLALDAIGINYRVSLLEQNIYGLIDVESLFVVMAAMVDYYGAMLLQEAQKKTLSPSGEESITPGLPEPCAPIAPVVANCTPLA